MVRTDPEIAFTGCGAATPTASRVLPTAPLLPVKVSPATAGASFTPVTVTVTVAESLPPCPSLTV